MQSLNLGNIGFTDRGQWVPSISYNQNDIVTHIDSIHNATRKTFPGEEPGISPAWNSWIPKVVNCEQNLDYTILYPGGTETNPGTISKSQRIELQNPFVNEPIITLAEIYINETWGETSLYLDNNISYFVKSSVLNDNIIVQTGTDGLLYNLSDKCGHSFGQLANSIITAPYRIKVWKLYKKG